MAAMSSNQNLWKILIGHSSLRDPDLIYDEVSACSQRLKDGLAHYKEPCAKSQKQLEGSKVKGTRLKFILSISSYLNLDQIQSMELFQAFLTDSCYTSFAEVSKKLSREVEQQKLLRQLLKYYMSERRHLLRCVKHLFGCWQDPIHPYRETYDKCFHLLDADKPAYIDRVFKQYENCARGEIPVSLKSEEEQDSWLLANLGEQCELLETILLYHKDYSFPPYSLLAAVKTFQAFGFGLRCHSRVGILPAAKVLVDHISHLCALIIVEGLDLDFVHGYQDDPNKFNLSEHPLMRVDFKRECNELASLISEWGDMRCHAPVLLAWTIFKFVTQPHLDMEQTRLLGNRALQGDVFGYLNLLLDSPFFCEDRPVSIICKSIVCGLLSCCVTAFSEDSLGSPMILISVATKSLSHPRLRLEFWTKGMDAGVGLLLSSALKRFPFDLSSVSSFLEPLAMDDISAQNVFHQLSKMEQYTDDFTRIPSSNIDLGEEAGSWILTQPLHLYPRESQRLGFSDFVLPAGTEGVVTTPDAEMDSRQLISWQVSYSAWDFFALITCSTFHSHGVGIDPAPSALVDDVTAITKLVTQLLRYDWSLEPHLRPITSQYFTLLQKFSSLPHPPSLLLAEALKCVSVMAANNPHEVWKKLSRTGFLPHINLAGSSIEMISVAPGHYGQLMNSWERPRGIYPFSMAMLDLLLGGIPPGEGDVGDDILACVILVMREMFSGSHSWRYRHSSNRNQIGHKLLQLCHMILSRPKTALGNRYSVSEFVQHFLLHSVGSHSLLNTLSLSLDTVNSLYSSRLGVSSPVLQVEALKLAFKVIDLLLLSKTDQSPTPLEQALATQSLKRKADAHSIPRPVHLVAIIASYIHHHDDPHVPAGATKLLRRLSQVAPMSVFACLGSESISIRDAYIHRLKSHVEDTELKVTILELITECVSSQPGMMELFLMIQPAPPSTTAHSTKAAYTLGEESCLNIIFDFITTETTPPTLLQSSMYLLRCLWEGRHDAAIIALRAQKDFWKHLTRQLFSVTQSSCHEMDYLISCHVMYIVALEVYNVIKDKMDAELLNILKDFSSKGLYLEWMKHLRRLPPTTTDNDESAVKAQLQLAQAWSTLLCVASANDKIFCLSDLKVRRSILQELLATIDSQLDSPTPPTSLSIAIATELSVLYMVLLKKWITNTKTFGSSATVELILSLLSRCVLLGPQCSLELVVHIYGSLLLLLSNLRDNKECLEEKFVLDLIPFLEETFKNHSLYTHIESKHRPDIVALCLLNEVTHSLLHLSFFLDMLKQHSIMAMLGTLLREHLHLTTDLEFVESVFGFFISLACSKEGSEVLLLHSINNHINITLPHALATKEEWGGTWLQSLQLMSCLLQTLRHQFLSNALDFVGVYQEKIMRALDIYHVITNLASLEETRRVSHFLYQLSLFKQQWMFATPALHSDLLERVVVLTGSAAAAVSKRATLKQIIKTMNTLGYLSAEEGPLGGVNGGRRRRGAHVRTLSMGKEETGGGVSWLDGNKMEEVDDSWILTSPAYTQLQDGLISILTSCLAMLRHYSPPLEPMIMEGRVDMAEYVPLFSLSLAPPTVHVTGLPSLATLTTCLSTGVSLMNKMEPSRSIGTPSRSPGKSPPSLGRTTRIFRSPGKSPSWLAPPSVASRSPIKSPPSSLPPNVPSLQKRVEYICFLEQVVYVLLSQTTRYLIDPRTHMHDKLQLKKELANELGNFTADLLRNFTRKGAPSPGGSKTTPPSRSHTLSLQDSYSSGKGTSFAFSDTSEQAMFKLADCFSKQFFR